MKEYELSKILDDYIDLRELFQIYGYPVNRAGFCRCPFHSERTASCKVDKVKYHCFGCGAKGNAISLVKNMYDLDFKTAIQKINDDCHLYLLSSELTDFQRKKIKAREITKYKKMQQDDEIKQKMQTYLDAWRQYIIYKPREVAYNIDTDEFLIDEFWASIDKRWFKAIETLNLLEDEAFICGYNIDEDDAINMFTKKVG